LLVAVELGMGKERHLFSPTPRPIVLPNAAASRTRYGIDF
jgi:hypothetical protein